MRFRSALTAWVLLLCGVNDALAQLQSPSTNPTTATTNSPATSTAPNTSGGSPSNSPSSSLTSTPASSQTKVNPKSTQSTRHGHGTLTTSTSSATATPHANTTTSIHKGNHEEALPLKPVITPALGLAGVFLILAGLALTLIGIKHKTVQIFLSTTLLTSLAVTVLIIYLMSPPISEAVQGGFFVAAFVSGLFFGGISLIFQEVTEGLGCLLGGFCLAMWFLVLAPGGLVKSTTGRAVMIAVFCAVGWSLSFSRYTRNQGLIVATSFAGATATVIGVDCFSRAGLSQFWLYLWNLNGNIFPLGTKTYPITRGIRVEIAIIIVLFLFGLMSQFKIWKIVKERREKASMDRIRDLESRDQHDADAGREIEARNERDLKEWEAQYGGKEAAVRHTDSGLGSSVGSFQKRSTSVTEREMDTIEMDEMAPAGMSTSKRGSKGEPRSRVTVNLASEEDWAQERAAWGSSQQNLINSDESYKRRSQTSLSASHHNLSETMEAVSERDEFEYDRADRPPIPQVVPLPFSPPVDHEQDDEADRGSLGTRVTVGQTVAERRGTRLSLSSLKKHTSRQPHTNVPQIEEDRASSIAAIADGESDDDLPPETRRSQMVPALDHVSNKGGLTPQSEEVPSRPLSYVGSAAPENPLEENDDEALVRPSPVVREQTPPPPPPIPQEDAEVATQRSERRSISASRRKSKSVKSRRSSWDGEPPATEQDGEASVIGSLSGHLPEKLSKVALAYRTNEWAKHIADADQPTDDQPESHSPGIQVDRAFAEEAARPVDPAGLVGGSTIEGDAAGVPRKTSKSNTNPYRKSKQQDEKEARASKRVSASALAAPTPVYAAQPNADHAVLQRQASASSMVTPQKTQPRLSQRVSAAPLLAQEPLVESPIEENAVSPPMLVRNFSTPLVASASTGNLLDERNDRLKRKTTTTSFNAINASTPQLVAAAADARDIQPTDVVESDRRSVRSRKSLISEIVEDEENMTLAERKVLMRHRRQSQPELPTESSPQPPMPIAQITADRRISHRQSSLPLQHTTSFTSPGQVQGQFQTQGPPQPSHITRASTIQGAAATSSNKALIYDSHQPQRGSAVDPVKQANMLTQWRSSLVTNPQTTHTGIGGGANITGRGATDPAGPTPQQKQQQRQAEENARASMIAQKQWAAFNRQKSAEEEAKRQSMREQAMRSGQMMGAHQDVLRRMQAKANRSAGLAEQ